MLIIINCQSFCRLNVLIIFLDKIIEGDGHSRVGRYFYRALINLFQTPNVSILSYGFKITLVSFYFTVKGKYFRLIF